MAQKVEVEITGKDAISPVLSKAEMGFAKLKATAEGNAKGIRQLDNTFQDAIQSSLKLTGATNSLAGALIEFIPGGLVAAGVIGGISMMVTHYQKLKEAAKEAEKSARDLRIELLKARGKEVEAAVIPYKEADAAYQKAAAARMKTDKEIADFTTLRNSKDTDGYAALGLAAEALQTKRTKQVEIEIAAQSRLEISGLAVAKAEETRVQNVINAADKKKADDKKREDLEKEHQKKLHEIIVNAWHETNNAIERLDQMARDKAAGTAVLATQKETRQSNLKIGLTGGQRLPVVPPDSIVRKAAEPQMGLTADQQEKQKVLDKEQADRMANTSNLVYGIADAYEMLFATIGQGGAAYAQLGQAFSRMIGDMAKKKMMFELGEGISALFTPGMQGLAAGHFQAAAIFGALAGLASAAGSAIGANNQGSRRDPNSNLGDPRGLEMGSVTINIVGGGLLDMNNPDTQRSFVKAIEAIGNKRVVVSGGK